MPDQSQIADVLADNFVTGGKRDQMREAFERDDVALVHEAGDRFIELEELAHRAPMIIVSAR